MRDRGPIYEPKGHAAPYAKLALNPYLTCPMGCPYCYNAIRDPRFSTGIPRIQRGSPDALLEQLDRQCAEWPSAKHPVHMTFLGDCYQPAEEAVHVTERCIKVLHSHGFPVQILTKNPRLAERDFHLLDRRDKFGVTIVDKTLGRLASLLAADLAGIPVWLSLEPVLNPNDAVDILRDLENVALHPDPLWIGPRNHGERGYDWGFVKSRLRYEADQLGLKVQFKDEV